MGVAIFFVFVQQQRGGVLKSRLTISITGLLLIAAVVVPGMSEKVFEEQNGYVCIEAESVTPEGEWLVHTDNSEHEFIDGFTGGGCIHFIGNSERSGSPKDPITYNVKINAPGDYALIIRGLEAPMESNDGTWANDCYAKMEGQSDYLGEFTKHVLLGGSYSWSWGVEAEDGTHNFKWPVYDLSVGTHQFKIAGRSKNFMIDRFVLYKDITKDEAEDITLEPSPVAGAINVDFNEPQNTNIPLDSSIIVDISASTDSGVIESVTLRVDGTEEESIDGTPLATEITGLSKGSHEFTAVAYTDYGDSGKTTLSINVYDEGDILYVKAESGSMADGMSVVSDADAISGQAIYGTNGSTSAPSDGHSKAEYTVTIPSEGSWYAWGRFSYPDDTHNSFWISVDGGTSQRFANGDTYDQYHWEGHMNEGAVDLGNLSAGDHTITVYVREPGQDNLLDALCIASNENYTPSDADVEFQSDLTANECCFVTYNDNEPGMRVVSNGNTIQLQVPRHVVVKHASLVSVKGAVVSRGTVINDARVDFNKALSISPGVYIFRLDVPGYGIVSNRYLFR